LYAVDINDESFLSDVRQRASDDETKTEVCYII